MATPVDSVLAMRTRSRPLPAAACEARDLRGRRWRGGSTRSRGRGDEEAAMEEARRREARTPATAMDTVRSALLDCYDPEGCVAAGSLEMLAELQLLCAPQRRPALPAAAAFAP